MNVELATMIQTVSVWAVFCLIVYLLSAIVGVSGNQLNRVKLRLDKLNKSNIKAITSSHNVAVTKVIKLNTIKRLSFYTKRIIGNIDLYLFDHREDKINTALKLRLEELSKKYTNLLIVEKKNKDFNNDIYSFELSEASGLIEKILNTYFKKEKSEDESY